jgi:hypothetical protein
MSPFGAIVMSSFAAIWFLVGAAGSGRGSPLTYGIGLVVSAVIIVAAWRQQSRSPPQNEGEARRTGRLIGIASAIEGAVIFVGANVLANIGRRGFIAPMVAIVVGLHFLPLARWLPAASYYATAVVLVAIGAAGCFVADAQLRVWLVCAGAASALWLTSLFVLGGGNRRARD